jgi:hypothetical protein
MKWLAVQSGEGCQFLVNKVIIAQRRRGLRQVFPVRLRSRPSGKLQVLSQLARQRLDYLKLLRPRQAFQMLQYFVLDRGAHGEQNVSSAAIRVKNGRHRAVRLEFLPFEFRPRFGFNMVT